jgi:hypothetical protein
MQIEDIVGVRVGIGNEVDMEDGNRGWNLEDIAGEIALASTRKPHDSSNQQSSPTERRQL